MTNSFPFTASEANRIASSTLAKPLPIRCKLFGHKGQIVANVTNSFYCTLVCTRCGKCKRIRL